MRGAAVIGCLILFCCVGACATDRAEPRQIGVDASPLHNVIRLEGGVYSGSAPLDGPGFDAGFGGGFAPGGTGNQGGPPDKPVRHSFAPGRKDGPEADFRDGSGNDVDFDDDVPPF